MSSSVAGARHVPPTIPFWGSGRSKVISWVGVPTPSVVSVMFTPIDHGGGPPTHPHPSAHLRARGDRTAAPVAARAILGVVSQWAFHSFWNWLRPDPGIGMLTCSETDLALLVSTSWNGWVLWPGGT